jgi:hypothetical protein
MESGPILICGRSGSYFIGISIKTRNTRLIEQHVSLKWGILTSGVKTKTYSSPSSSTVLRAAILKGSTASRGRGADPCW